MSPRHYNILFLCIGNSARSILAEGLVTHLSGGRFQGYSAGSQPIGHVNPLALETLRNFGCATEGFSSKSWDVFASADAPAMDFIITVCDNAAGEACPLWPGKPVSAHWGVPDPASVEGPEEKRRKAFMDAALTLKRRIELFLSLPLHRLDAMSLQQELRDIGHR